jgi:hypothetical protein
MALFWQMDVPGIVLLIAVFGCILTVSCHTFAIVGCFLY